MRRKADLDVSGESLLLIPIHLWDPQGERFREHIKIVGLMKEKSRLKIKIWESLTYRYIIKCIVIA